MKFPVALAAGALAVCFAEPPSALLQKAKTAFEAQQWKEAEARASQLLKQAPKSASAEEAAVLLIDVTVRQDKTDLAASFIQRFRRQFGASAYMPRVLYYQGLTALKTGRNLEAAQYLAAAASQAKTQAVYVAAGSALRQLADGGGLLPVDLEAAGKAVARDPILGPALLESLGDGNSRLGRYQAAEATFSDYLDRYPKTEGTARVRGKLEKMKAAPHEGRNVLLMAPFSGEFAEVGRSQREGALLAFEEAQRRGVVVPGVKLLDDQGNLILGVQLFRKMLREERVDAVIGPAMSDVATGVAVELSARKSPIPLITPTATTHGIASLGESMFQLNVTTYALGQRIAEYACDCLGLKDFAIVAPHNEYGFQLAEVFAKTVEKKGGFVAAAAYVDPEATDLAEPLQELRQKVARRFFDQMKWEGQPLPEAKEMRSWMADSAFPVDGIFIPAGSGDEANKLASQVVFNKIRGQMLGSSGWYDKSLLLKNSAATHGAYFSVDFQDQPKTDVYAAFSKAYQARWKRIPDRVAALSYDAARFLLAGMAKAEDSEKLVPALREVRVFPGVLGDIVFAEEEGVNQNTALFHLEKKTFKEVPGCPGAPAESAGKDKPGKK